MTEIKPGKFVVVNLTKYGLADLQRIALECQQELDPNVDLDKPGLFLIVHDDTEDTRYHPPPAWVASYIAGNKYATGEFLDEAGESIILQRAEISCHISHVIDHDDQEGLTKAFQVLNG